MLIGTNVQFKILYFITTMSPAYLLFTISLIPENVNLMLISSNFPYINIWILVVIMEVLLFILLGNRLSRMLTKQSLLVNSGCERGTLEYSMNKGLVEFLMSIVISSTISLVMNQVFLSVIVVCLFQLILFILVCYSTDLIPNIILLIFGWSYVGWKEKHLFIKSKLYKRLVNEGIKSVNGTRIGDSLSGIFVYVEEEQNEDQ